MFSSPSPNPLKAQMPSILVKDAENLFNDEMKRDAEDVDPEPQG